MRHLPIIISTVVLLSLASPAIAEVSRTLPGGTIIFGGTHDDPDPIGVWGQYRPIPGLQVLNASGDARGDGPPDLAAITDDLSPLGVWAYNTGTDHDIAFAEWTGSSWTPNVFLTNATDNEQHPKATREPDGTVHVVWENTTTGQVLLASRPAGGGSVWGVPVIVADGRRPSIAVDGGSGDLLVAFETDGAVPGVQKINMATHEGSGWSTVVIASASSPDALVPMVHVEAGQVWVDWIGSAANLGCSEKEPDGWTGVELAPRTSVGWVGVEETRRAIRRQVLSP